MEKPSNDLHREMTPEEKREAEEKDLVNATAIRLGHRLPMWQAEIIARQIATQGPSSKMGEEIKRKMDNWRDDDGNDTGG